LARRVTALKYHYDTAAGILDPVLQLQQFNLEHALQVIVFITGHPLGVGVFFAPGVHLAPVSVTEHRVVLVGIIHPHPWRDHTLAIRPVRARVTCVGLPSFTHIRPHPVPDHALTRGIRGRVTTLPRPRSRVHREFTAWARSRTRPFACRQGPVVPGGTQLYSLLLQMIL